MNEAGNDMKRIIIAVFTLIFVQLVKSETQACIDAITVRAGNDICTGVNGTDPNILCMGTCRNLIDNIIDNCDNEVSFYWAIGYIFS